MSKGVCLFPPWDFQGLKFTQQLPGELCAASSRVAGREPHHHFHTSDTSSPSRGPGHCGLPLGYAWLQRVTLVCKAVVQAVTLPSLSTQQTPNYSSRHNLKATSVRSPQLAGPPPALPLYWIRFLW